MVDANLQRFDEAMTELDEAEKIDPNYDETYVYRAQLYTVKDNLPAAMSEFRRALALNPDNPDARAGIIQLQQVKR
jgi:Tfp pilus assembly protein PilF